VRTTTFRPGFAFGIKVPERQTFTRCGRVARPRTRIPESIELGGTARVSQWIRDNAKETLEPERAAELLAILAQRDCERQNREWRARSIAQQQLPIRCRLCRNSIDTTDGNPAVCTTCPALPRTDVFSSSSIVEGEPCSPADRRDSRMSPRSLGWGHVYESTDTSRRMDGHRRPPARYRAPRSRLEARTDVPRSLRHIFGNHEATQAANEDQEQSSAFNSRETPPQAISPETVAAIQNDSRSNHSGDPRKYSRDHLS
jgi:hypothetical protein